MTGFKSGASDDDPFDDDPRETTDTEPVTTAEPRETLPWLYRRESITDGRKTVQLHLQPSTLDAQRDARREAERLLGESVNKADLREAALLVGLEHIDETVDRMREWGYGLE